MVDVAIVGGGPAGLAAAAFSARAGLSVALFDRRELPADKACGEGVMPAGVRTLDALGVRELLSASDVSPFVGIRYLQEDGTAAEAMLPDGGGLGVRRTALAAALLQRAQEAGVDLHPREAVRSHRREGEAVILATDRGHYQARMLVAADGLHSALRRAEGLESEPIPGLAVAHRYGVRQHFAVAPWTGHVEVHFCDAAEAYVTPCGAERVGIAFLWEDGRVEGDVSFESLLDRFAVLRERLRGTPPGSKPQGAGPFLQSARRLTCDRFALLGDAAGYVDALTGEGISLALRSAEVLGRVLPDALARGASREALGPYERFARACFARYARITHAMLILARRPRLRRAAVHALARAPRAFDGLVRMALR